MTEEQTLIYLKSQQLCCRIEMEAMIAENKQREILGQSMAYTERAFMSLINRYEIGQNNLLAYFNK